MDPASKQSQLRFGIMCHGMVFREFEAKTIREILKLRNVQPALLILDQKDELKTASQQVHPLRLFLYRGKKFLTQLGSSELVYQWIRRFVVKHAKAHQSVDLSAELRDIPKIYCRPEKVRGGYDFSQDLEQIKSYRLDFILRFGFGIIRGDILNLPKYGIWSFHQSDEQKYRGRPAAFWEIYHADPKTGAVLQKLTERLDGGVILKKDFFKTIRHSYVKNIDQVYLEAARWPAEVCRDILQGKADYLAAPPSTTKAPIYHNPNNLQAIIFLMKLFKNKCRHQIKHGGPLSGVYRFFMQIKDVQKRWLLANERLKEKYYMVMLKAKNTRLKSSSSRCRNSEGKILIAINIDTEGPAFPDKNKDWPAVRREVGEVMAHAFRNRYPDTGGQHLKLNWYLVDWVGGESPTAKRDIGYHKIFDHYQELFEASPKYGDGVYWHYHHVYPGNVDSCNRDWKRNPQYEEILSRLILDRHFFPVCFRSGNTWENNDVSQWLEDWIPFDFSSRAPHRGWNFDWSKAPTDWKLYHPGNKNFQRPGDMTRLIGRSLGIEKGWFLDEEIERAFLKASQGESAYLSFFTHDYRPMCDWIEKGLSRIWAMAKQYPHIQVSYADALTLFRELADRHPPEKFKLTARESSEEWIVEANLPIQGPQPWLAAQDESGVYKRFNFEKLDKQGRNWSLRKDVFSSGAKRIAVGAADIYGQMDIIKIL